MACYAALVLAGGGGSSGFGGSGGSSGKRLLSGTSGNGTLLVTSAAPLLHLAAPACSECTLALNAFLVPVNGVSHTCSVSCRVCVARGGGSSGFGGSSGSSGEQMCWVLLTEPCVGSQ
jgi:hypothetical protein